MGDMLSSMCDVLLNSSFEFKSPFQYYGDQFSYTIFNNFTMHLCFVLLRRLAQYPEQEA